MTQPSYVPVSEADQVRQVERLRVPGSWRPSRPAEIKGARQPSGRELGRLSAHGPAGTCAFPHYSAPMQTLWVFSLTAQMVYFAPVGGWDR